MPHRNYFRDRRTKVSAAGSPEILSFEPREPDRVYHITRVAVENETSIGTGDMRIAITGHGWVHPLRQFSAPAPDVVYVEDREFILLEGEALEARFSGTTASDILQMYFEGWWEPTTPGEPG